MSHEQAYPPLLPGIEYGYVDHLSDPRCELYRSFELAKGAFWQLLGPSVWWRGLLALLRGHRPGRLDGDGMQMPGVFLISDERIVHAHRAKHAGDHGDLKAFVVAAAV